MPVTTRVALLVLALLLSACSSRAPSPQPSYPPATGQVQGGADDVLFRALGLVGTPYRYGGNSPDGGFD